MRCTEKVDRLNLESHIGLHSKRNLKYVIFCQVQHVAPDKRSGFVFSSDSICIGGLMFMA